MIFRPRKALRHARKGVLSASAVMEADKTDRIPVFVNFVSKIPQKSDKIDNFFRICQSCQF